MGDHRRGTDDPCLFLVDEDEREIEGTRRTIRATMSPARVTAMADELRTQMSEATFLRERLPDGSIRRLN